MEYFEINEDLARQAKRMNSFRDYVEDSATNKYISDVNKVRDTVDNIKADYELDDYNTKRLNNLLYKYEKGLADCINQENKIDARYPSVMISGGGGFDNKKKDKQNAARSKNYELYKEVESYKYKLETFQPMKKRVEKRYAKTTISSMDIGGAEVKLVKNLFEIVQNEELNRIQLIFKDKPDEVTRTVLKKNGFKWAPSKNAWQRQTTPNAVHALKRVIETLKEVE